MSRSASDTAEIRIIATNGDGGTRSADHREDNGTDPIACTAQQLAPPNEGSLMVPGKTYAVPVPLQSPVPPPSPPKSPVPAPYGRYMWETNRRSYKTSPTLSPEVSFVRSSSSARKHWGQPEVEENQEDDSENQEGEGKSAKSGDKNDKSKMDNEDKEGDKTKDEEEIEHEEWSADDIQASIVRLTLRDVAVRLADCDDVNAAWQSRLADADVAVSDVNMTCHNLIRRNQQSERTYRMLQGENSRLQARVEQTNYLLENGMRHRFTAGIDTSKPGHMVEALLASLPPSAFD